MMFRPRESYDLRLIRTGLTIEPKPVRMRWLHDPFDNSLAIAEFAGETRELRFDSVVALEHFESPLPEYPLEEHAKSYPFRYSDDDVADLARGLTNHFPAAETAMWALQFLDSANSTTTMKILRSMMKGIRERFTYRRREEKGVQTPEETLRTGAGSCRDFALLMMEGARTLGIAARFVSGYIFVQGGGGSADLGGGFGGGSGTRGGGATHAWMQAYLPGAGWIDFDPTNSIVGNRNLIRVGVAWTPQQVLPLSGTYAGAANAFEDMDVTVSVTEEI